MKPLKLAINPKRLAQRLGDLRKRQDKKIACARCGGKWPEEQVQELLVKVERRQPRIEQRLCWVCAANTRTEERFGAGATYVSFATGHMGMNRAQRRELLHTVTRSVRQEQRVAREQADRLVERRMAADEQTARVVKRLALQQMVERVEVFA